MKPTKNMGITVLPKTGLGKWSLGLALVALALFLVREVGLQIGSRMVFGTPQPFSSLLPIAALLSVPIGAAACVLSLISLLSNAKERSILVMAIVVSGVAVFVLVVSQMLNHSRMERLR